MMMTRLPKQDTREDSDTSSTANDHYVDAYLTRSFGLSDAMVEDGDDGSHEDEDNGMDDQQEEVVPILVEYGIYACLFEVGSMKPWAPKLYV
jgi:hypothetical protein